MTRSRRATTQNDDKRPSPQCGDTLYREDTTRDETTACITIQGGIHIVTTQDPCHHDAPRTARSSRCGVYIAPGNTAGSERSHKQTHCGVHREYRSISDADAHIETWTSDAMRRGAYPEALTHIATTPRWYSRRRGHRGASRTAARCTLQGQRADDLHETPSTPRGRCFNRDAAGCRRSRH